MLLRNIYISLTSLVLVGITGFLFGYLLLPAYLIIHQDRVDINFGLRKLDEFENDRIKKRFLFIAEKKHIAGSPRNEMIAKFIKENFELYLQHVHELESYVLLSLPNFAFHNHFSIVDESEKIEYFTSEDHLNRGSQFTPLFIAYVKSSEVLGDPIHVNCGTCEDYELLFSLGFNVSGKIVLIRQDDTELLSTKLQLAENLGAIGAIFYLDYKKVVKFENFVYPNTWWLPGNVGRYASAQYGRGDPSAPEHVSSRKNLYLRIPPRLMDLPKIPALSVGYLTGEMLLKNLTGDASQLPPEWGQYSKGIGPGLTNNLKVKLFAEMQDKLTKISTIVGYILGIKEPNRYIIIGGHYDDFVYGALKSGSAIANMLEIVHIFGHMNQSGWRPRRTIIFCAFDAGDFNHMGTYEYIFRYFSRLENVVAFINLMNCVNGNALSIRASPFLFLALQNSLKMMSHKVQPDITSTWSEELSRSFEKKDIVFSHGYASIFETYAAVPSVQIILKSNDSYGGDFYPAYNTVLDTIEYNDRFVDPKFVLHKTCSQTAFFFAFLQAEKTFVYYDFTPIVKLAETGINELSATIQKVTNDKKIVDEIKAAISLFNINKNTWVDYVKKVDDSDDNLVLTINNRMLNVARCFLMPRSMYASSYRKNLLMGQVGTSPKAVVFPGIHSMLKNLEFEKQGSKKYNKIFLDLKMHLAEVKVAFKSAANLLIPIHERTNFL